MSQIWGICLTVDFKTLLQFASLAAQLESCCYSLAWDLQWLNPSMGKKQEETFLDLVLELYILQKLLNS